MTHSSSPLALDVAVPVYNEQADLDRSVRTLHAYLAGEFDFAWRITIADNASTDATPAIADALAAEFPEVVAVHMVEKGRGRALKRVWLESPAEVVAYVDVDLSTDLSALPPVTMIATHTATLMPIRIIDTRPSRLEIAPPARVVG